MDGGWLGSRWADIICAIESRRTSVAHPIPGSWGRSILTASTTARWPIKWPETSATRLPMIVDYPASFHGGAGVFALADGHCVSHKWMGNTIKPPVTGNPLPLGNNSPPPDGGTIKDLIWWSSITTVHE